MKVSHDLPRTSEHAMKLPCVVCGAELPDPPWTSYLEFRDALVPVPDTAACPECDARYSGDLLRHAHPEAWMYALGRGLVCVEEPCGTAQVGAIYTGDEGQMIPCPRHGARVSA